MFFENGEKLLWIIIRARLKLLKTLEKVKYTHFVLCGNKISNNNAINSVNYNAEYKAYCRWE